MSLTEEWEEHEREIINLFFSVKVPEVLGTQDACTESSCIQFGQQVLATTDLKPVDNQGANSFTLISPAKSKIIQFRLKTFNTDILNLAHRVYGDQVPQTTLHTDFPLPVYSSDVILGRVHVLQSFSGPHFPVERQRKTVTDLGSFIAKATFFPQQKHYKPDSWTTLSDHSLRRLQQNESLRTLAPDLMGFVTRLQEQVHLLNKLPAVLTHHDLSELNIMVDDEGKVTGVIDFDAAGIEAFGMCIWGIFECFLGSMERGRWSFHNQPADDYGYPGQTIREVLETAFWETLWSSINPEIKQEEIEAATKVAMSIGIINRYFIEGMLDHIDETKKVHRLSLEYARGILPAI